MDDILSISEVHTCCVGESSQEDRFVVDVEMPSLPISYKYFKGWPGVG